MLLQSLDLRDESEIEGLFYRCSSLKERWTISAELVDDGLLLSAGTHLDADTYFNAFFERHWFQYTDLSTMDLRITCTGAGVISCYRVTPEQDLYLIGRETFDNAEPTEVRVDMGDDRPFRAEPGRVWFTIESHTDVVLHGGGWHTTDVPVRDVKLNAVWCTFNRLPYLRQILQDLNGSPAAIANVERFTIVNQGDPFTIADLGGVHLDAQFVAKLHIIEQPNMGGCGGFSRGMWETLHDDKLTHFVLLDDDIRVHPDSLVRTAGFLSFSKPDIVVGGHMLNLDRPNQLYEAGAVLNTKTMVPAALNSGLEIHKPGRLNELMSAPKVDYNGWWFFAADTDVIERVGLPMPCFIRGDDIEYGLRLLDNGIRTLPVPGIAVWHEPFYLKLGDWQLYFEIRNRLTMANLHPDSTDWKGLKMHFFKTFLRDISCSRYHSVMYLIEGIEDYLAGPDACFDTSPDALKKCLDIKREYGPTLAEETTTVIEDPGAPKTWSRRARLTRLASKGLPFLPIMAKRLAVPAKADDGPTYHPSALKILRTASADTYYVQTDDGERWRYSRNAKTERKLWQRFLPLLRNLGPNPQITEAAEIGKRAWYSRWEKIFDNAA